MLPDFSAFGSPVPQQKVVQSLQPEQTHLPNSNGK
jgi:hypothetical protein